MAAIAEALLYRPQVRLSMPIKLMYVLLKNPAPTPVEFAQLFAEVSLLDRASDAGPTLFSACKKAHRRHDPAFSFDALTEEEQREYRAACYNKTCPTCGDGVKAEDTFCSAACAAVACSRCQGKLETHEVEKEVYDLDRDVEISYLGDLLQHKGVAEPLPFQEQLDRYHPQCRSRVQCCAGCKGCQEKHMQWFYQHDHYKTYGDKGLSFWLRHEDRLLELYEQPVMKTVVSRETRCSKCGSEESGRRLPRRRRV